MLFNSLSFLVFFPTVVVAYFSIPHRYRWMLLLGASYYFYMSWKPEYILLIIASTLVDYFVGIRMGAITNPTVRKSLLAFSLIINLGFLFAFKYFNFFNDSARAIFNQLNIFYGVPEFQWLLPVGISFYTFQTLSYSIDVYKGKKEPEHHLGIFALYVAFFPQLVAGPIERSSRLLPQFYQKHHFDYQRVTNGLQLMLWGLFKKLVIADRLALYVNTVYNNPGDYEGAPVILATYFFAFQIYCDFSGYSDIAIGAAQVMGFDLMKNFDRPYASKSVAEFWRRWHISLSTWFRDYVYIPLGGNRVSKRRWLVNLFIIFLISGLWHGANWTFVIWGALHGFYLIAGLLTQDLRAKIVGVLRLSKVPLLENTLSVLITFHLVVFAWIFFRANSIGDALLIIQNMLKFDAGQLGINILENRYELIIAIAAITFMELVHLYQRNRQLRESISAKPVWFKWPVYYAMLLSILMFGEFNLSEFIYFQF